MAIRWVSPVGGWCPAVQRRPAGGECSSKTSTSRALRWSWRCLPGWGGVGCRGWLGRGEQEAAPATTTTPARWANGYSEEKPLSVPRAAPFKLKTCPLTAVDALGNSPAGCPVPFPWPTPWWVWLGNTLGWLGAGWEAELHTPPSSAFLLGVPMVCGLCCVLGRHVPLHRGLLLCGGSSEGNQHRCVLVSAHCCLLHVSFLLDPCAEEVGGRWDPDSSFPDCPKLVHRLSAAVLQTSPEFKTSTIVFMAGLSWATSSPSGPAFQQAGPSFLITAGVLARKRGCCRPPETLPNSAHPCPCPFSWSKQGTGPAQTQGYAKRALCNIFIQLHGGPRQTYDSENQKLETVSLWNRLVRKGSPS